MWVQPPQGGMARQSGRTEIYPESPCRPEHGVPGGVETPFLLSPGSPVLLQDGPAYAPVVTHAITTADELRNINLRLNAPVWLEGMHGQQQWSKRPLVQGILFKLYWSPGQSQYLVSGTDTHTCPRSVHNSMQVLNCSYMA